MTDINLDALICLTRRDALKEARRHLDAVVRYALDQGLSPDKADEDHIREALRLVSLAMKEIWK